MYSLGIIFFEMCFAFKTGMERVQTLTALRSATAALPFPTSWLAGEKTTQREIINLLLRHDPAMRPQATQLLNGPLVPTIDKEEKFYDDVITGEDEVLDITNSSQKSRIPALKSTTRWLMLSSTRIPTRLTWITDSMTTRMTTTTTTHTMCGSLLWCAALWMCFNAMVLWTTIYRFSFRRQPFSMRSQSERQSGCWTPTASLFNCRHRTYSPWRARHRDDRLNVSSDMLLVGSILNSLLEGSLALTGSFGGSCLYSIDASFDIVTPIRSLCAEAEVLELMDKIVTECQGAKSGSTHVEYEFHVSHESGELNGVILIFSLGHDPSSDTCSGPPAPSESVQRAYRWSRLHPPIIDECPRSSKGVDQ